MAMENAPSWFCRCCSAENTAYIQTATVSVNSVTVSGLLYQYIRGYQMSCSPWTNPLFSPKISVGHDFLNL